MKCIINEKVRDKMTGVVYQPKKDKNGKDIPQEVNQAFYDRAKGTKYIKEVKNVSEKAQALENEESKQEDKKINK